MNELLKFLLTSYTDYFPTTFYLPQTEEDKKNKVIHLNEKYVEDNINRAVELIDKDLIPELPREELTRIAIKFPGFIPRIADDMVWSDAIVKCPMFIYLQLEYPQIQNCTPLLVREDPVNGKYDPNWICARLFQSDRLEYLNEVINRPEFDYHEEVNPMTNHTEDLCGTEFRLGLFQFLYATEKCGDQYEHDEVFEWIRKNLSFGDIFRLSIESITDEYYHKTVELANIWDLIKMSNAESRKNGFTYSNSRYIYKNLIKHVQDNCKDADLVSIMNRL